MNTYPLESYDKDFALKPSVGTTLWLAFLVRGMVIAGMQLYLTQKAINFAAFFYSTTIALLASLVVAMPVFIIFAAWVRRHPSAGRIPRMIWARGGLLMIFSATLNLLLVAWSLSNRKLASSPDIAQLLLSCYCLFYVLRSKRLKDTFMSFPQAPKKHEV
jgi:hypothetical protein